MAIILALDASTTGCTVALFSNEKLVAHTENRADKSAGEMLTSMVAEVVEKANLTMQDINAVAIAKGPGSYTGLRIAVSTAKGLAFGLAVPLISFSTLELLCYQIEPQAEDAILCPMIDARRMEVFCGMYSATDKKLITEIEAAIIDENSFSELLAKHKIVFLGEGSEKCKVALKHPNAFFYDKIILPDVKYIGALVNQKFQINDFEDLVAFEPFYLKEYMFKTKKP